MTHPLGQVISIAKRAMPGEKYLTACLKSRCFLDSTMLHFRVETMNHGNKEKGDVSYQFKQSGSLIITEQ